MAESTSPVALEDLGDRLFSFYPPILNIEHNEWHLKKCEWSEVLVENARMGVELWVPRTWLGEVSKVEEPHVIVGLKREVEYKGGALVPYHRRVIGMPRPHAALPVPIHEMPRMPTAADELRSSVGGESNMMKTLGIVLVAALVLVVAAVGLSRLRNDGGTVSYKALEQRNIDLTYNSTYFDVVQKFGAPEDDRWRPGGGERRVRALVYKKEGLIVLLMGPDQNNDARYIGAKDLEWRNVHTVTLPGGATTDATLSSLQKF